MTKQRGSNLSVDLQDFNDFDRNGPSAWHLGVILRCGGGKIFHIPNIAHNSFDFKSEVCGPVQIHAFG